MLRRNLLHLAVLLTLSTVFFYPFSRGLAEGGVREIRVGVAVTSSFKTRADWKDTFLRRLAYASRIFESEFRIKFTPAVFWDWNPKDERRDMNYLMEDLKSHYPLEGVDIVVGLSRLEQIHTVEEMRDMEALGRSQPFSGYMIVRAPEKPIFKIQEETVLIHELGHLFGAIHASESDSIMAPYVDRQIPSRFDSVNREIISRTRNVDFKKGTQSLDAQTIQQLLNAYIRFAKYAQSFEFYYSLGVFYVKLGQFEEARKAWEEAVQIDPKVAQIHYDLGVLLSKMGNQEKAISELSKAVSQFNHPSERMNKLEALMMLGNAYFQKGALEAAYRAWSDVAVIDPENFEAKLNLATIRMQGGQTEQAVQEFNRLLLINPRHPTILSNLGAAYYQKGQYQKAIDYLKRALEAAPKASPDIYQHIALSYMALNQNHEALQYLEQSCRLNPTVDCHRKTGEIYFKLGMWDQTAQELAGVLRYQKEDPMIYGMLGVALFQKGDRTQALAIFQEGIKYAKDHAAAAQLYRNIGTMHFQVKEFDQAALAFQQAISHQWNNAEAHFGLAMVYVGQSRFEDARQSLKTALGINPNHEGAKELLGKVEEVLSRQGGQTVTRTQGVLVH